MGGFGPRDARRRRRPGALPAAPTLAALSLATPTLAENAAPGTLVGVITGRTPGSTLSLANDAGGRFAISGMNLVAGLTATNYEAATSHAITIRETLAGATNTPRDTVLSVAVTNVFEAASLAALGLSATAFAIGSATSGTITGATAGSTIAASGLPTGLTINGPARTWAWDGSGGAGSSTVTLTETLADSANSPRASAVGVAVAAPTFVQLAARFLAAKRAAPAGIAPVIATPPTVTVAAVGANSTLTGNSPTAPAILPNDAAVRQVAGVLANKGGGAYGTAFITANGTLDGSTRGFGLAFMFTGQSFDFSFRANATATGAGDTTRPYRIRIDGEWVTTAPPAAAGTGAGYVTVDFGSTVTGKRVEIYFNRSNEVYGLNLGSGASIALPSIPSTDLRGLVLGDSYTAGFSTSPVDVRFGLFTALGSRLGIRNIVPSGVGGQGWVAVSQGETFGSRITAGDTARTGTMDLIVLYGSVNDSAGTAATMQANAQAGLQAVCTAHPNAIKLCLSHFVSAAQAVTTARQDAVRDGFLAGADARTVVLDLRTLGLPAIQGTTGDTNHPTSAEALSVAAFLADAFEAKLVNLGFLGATSFADDFERANANLEASANWTRVDGTAGDVSIVGGIIQSNTTDTNGAAYRSPDLGATASAIAYIPSGVHAGPVVCAKVIDRSNWVGFRVNTGPSVDVYTKIAGTVYTLANFATTLNFTTDEIALEVIGETYRVRKNGVSIGTGNMRLNIAATAVPAFPDTTRSGVVARTAAVAFAKSLRTYVP